MDISGLKDGEQFIEPVIRLPDRPYIQAEAVFVGQISGPEPMLEMIAIQFRGKLSGQTFVVQKVSDDEMKATSGDIQITPEMMDVGGVRMSPRTALNAGAALLEHGLKTGLMKIEDIQARLQAAGVLPKT